MDKFAQWAMVSHFVSSIAWLLIAGGCLYALCSYFSERKRRLEQEEYTRYQALLRYVLEPLPSEPGELEGRNAALYELTYYEKYAPLTERILQEYLKQKEGELPERFKKELKMTIRQLGCV